MKSKMKIMFVVISVLLKMSTVLSTKILFDKSTSTKKSVDMMFIKQLIVFKTRPLPLNGMKRNCVILLVSGIE